MAYRFPGLSVSVATGAILLLGTGCATPPSALSPQQRAAISTGQRSVVLLRLETTFNDRPVVARKLGLSEAGPFALALANLDRNGPIEPEPVTAPAGESKEGTWCCLVMEPGTYYLWSALPNIQPRDLSANPKDIGGWRLNVPSGAPVVYAGSLQLKCQGRKFINERFVKEIRANLWNEPAAAAAFADRELAGLGPMTVSLLQRFGGWIGDSPATDRLPALLVVHGQTNLITPDWKRRAIEQTMLPARTLASLSGGYGPGAGGGVVLALAYTPFGWLVGRMKGSSDAHTWQPCLENLAQEIRLFDPLACLRSDLAVQMGTNGILAGTPSPVGDEVWTAAYGQKCRSVLQADVARIQFREVSGGFCLEALLRVRVWDAVSRQCCFEAHWLYSHPRGKQLPGESGRAATSAILEHLFPPPYVTLLSVSSQSYKLDDWCGAGGQQILRDELTKAIHQAVGETTEALGLR